MAGPIFRSSIYGTKRACPPRRSERMTFRWSPRRRSSRKKDQAPKSKLRRNIKHQHQGPLTDVGAPRLWVWSLVFLWILVLGAWIFSSLSSKHLMHRRLVHAFDQHVIDIDVRRAVGDPDQDLSG